MNFKLNDYPGYNIGGVLMRNYDKIKQIADKYNCITLLVCNGIWHGSYRIPTCVGFSTPTSMCKNATLSVCHGGCDLDKTNIRWILRALLEWDKIYECEVTRKDNIITFTENHLSCYICTENYTKGDKVILLECDHQFHYDCMNQWRTKGMSNAEVFIQTENMKKD